MRRTLIHLSLTATLLILCVFGLHASGWTAKHSAQSVPVGTYGSNSINQPAADGYNLNVSQQPVRSVSIFDDTRRPPLHLRATAASSPGIIICAGTAEDHQANDDGQRAIASFGGATDRVHFAYTYFDHLPSHSADSNRFVLYNAWTSSGGLAWPPNGAFVSIDDRGRAGYASIDITTGDTAYVAYHQRNASNQVPPGPSSSFVGWQFVPGGLAFQREELSGSITGEAVWPHLAIQKGAGNDIFHVVARPSGSQVPYSDEIFYWRRDGSSPWAGPVVLVDDAFALNHHVAVDPVGSKVAVIYEHKDATPLLQVQYLEDVTRGLNWLSAPFPTPYTAWSGTSPTVVTNYTNPSGEQAWTECTGEYDRIRTLHIVWVEQLVAETSPDCRIKHWDDATGVTRTVVEAIGWGNTGSDGPRDLWLASPQIAFGTGSTTCNSNLDFGTNFDYIYMTYEQYGGPTATEENDVSAAGYQNLEIYLTASPDEGETWGNPINLTATNSPGCSGDCASERDPSISVVVDDAINISYVLDKEAGDAPLGQGAWTMNPVMYYRIPSATDDAHFCPPVPSSVVVESKTVMTNESFTVGVFLENSVELISVDVPLVIRSLSGGAYPSAITGRYPSGTRLEGHITNLAYSILAFEQEDGSCKEGFPGGFGTLSAQSHDGSSVSVPNPGNPDAVEFARAGVPSYLPAGSDGPIPSIEIGLNAGSVAGQFIVDTTCTDFGGHLKFLPSAGGSIPVTFTPGIITVNAPPSTVVVESKTVQPFETFDLGVYLTNTVDLRGVILPLAIYSLTNGAYPSAISGQFTAGSRLDGFLTEVQDTRAYENLDGNCKSGNPGGFGTQASNGTGSSVSVPTPGNPDALLFARNKILGPNWPAGTDGAVPSIQLTFTAGSAEGLFLIDTTCTDPASHLYFINNVGISVPVEFTPGFVAVSACNCPWQGDMDENGEANATDLNLAIQVYFFNATDPQDPGCPTTRADFNADGEANATDLNMIIQQLFFNGPPPTDPCAP